MEMTDLTKITTPFGLLDEETQEALRNCDGPWEVFWETQWRLIQKPNWSSAFAYRQTPLPTTYPKIPWEHVDEKWQFWARDESGDGWLYADKPKCDCIMWDAHVARESDVLKLDPGTCDWRDSLVERPK